MLVKGATADPTVIQQIGWNVQRPKYQLHVILLFLLDFKRLANFTVLVGGNSDWHHNYHCFSRLPPVPKGATVEYPCENLRFGHLVTINKTASVGGSKTYWMLMLHEVEVFGYKSGMITLANVHDKQKSKSANYYAN